MDIISVYTKKEAVEDGSQMLVSDLAKEQGFNVPVYITSGVVEYCNPPEGLEGVQDFKGRLWDVLTLARMEALRMKKEEDYFGKFTVSFLMKNEVTNDVSLFIVFNEHEGFTIMLPDEY
ncbi:MAG: DUF6573 family protein [Elusimicrobiota bacterium]